MSAFDRVRDWLIAPPDAARSPRRSKRPSGPVSYAADDTPLPRPEAAAPQPVGRAGATASGDGAFEVTSAAVLGRAGEVEPFAAALALALRRTTRAKAAAVGVLGGELPSVEGAIASGAARRIAVRAQAHGLDACARGRLAWVRLSVEDQRLPLTARRVTLIAAPAVLAVTTARTAAIDETLAERDLVVLVTGDPEGPLATLASAGLDDALLIHAPRLPRGPATTLARAGLHPPRPVRRLLTDLLEGHA